MKQADPASVFGSNTHCLCFKQNAKTKEMKSNGVHSVSMEEFQNTLKDGSASQHHRGYGKMFLLVTAGELYSCGGSCQL